MKTKSFQSVAMIAVCVLAFGCLVATRSHASVVFYGGDSPEKGSRLSSYSSSAGLVMVFDDFELSQPTTINKLWGNFSTGGSSFTSFAYGDAVYEIRSGVTSGSGGTLWWSGMIKLEATQTGRNFGNDAELQLAGLVDLFLPAGTYWLGIAPISEQAQLLSTTSGADVGPNGLGADPNPEPTGSPRVNGNSFFYNGATDEWLSTTDSLALGNGTWDFSYGLEGTTVPEPSTFIAGALLALPFGLQGFRYLRNRRRT